MRVYIHRRAGIGDGLLLVPALRALRSDYPQAHITHYGHPDAAQWLLRQGFIDTIHDAATVPAGMDVVLGFSSHPPRWRQSHFACGARSLTASRHLGPAGTHQALHHYQQLQRALPLRSPYDPAPIDALERDADYGDAIVLCPGTAHPLKVWPHFRRLAAALGARGHRVVILDRIIPRWARRYEGITGTFAEAASIIASARLVIGNDSSACHLAGLVNTPAIAIFGPSLSAHWHPLGTSCTVISGCPSILGKAHTNRVIACRKGDCWDLVPLSRVLDLIDSRLSTLHTQTSKESHPWHPLAQ